MLFFSYGLAALAVTFAPRVAAVASTDSYTDADVMQSGYLPNHNMDPNVVNSAQFGQLWKVPFNSKEQVILNPPHFDTSAVLLNRVKSLGTVFFHSWAHTSEPGVGNNYGTTG